MAHERQDQTPKLWLCAGDEQTRQGFEKGRRGEEEDVPGSMLSECWEKSDMSTTHYVRHATTRKTTLRWKITETKA